MIVEELRLNNNTRDTTLTHSDCEVSEISASCV